MVVTDCEIERSILLEGSRVKDIDMMLRDSLIGRNASVKSNKEIKPRGVVMNVADNSTLWI